MMPWVKLRSWHREPHRCHDDTHKSRSACSTGVVMTRTNQQVYRRLLTQACVVKRSVRVAISMNFWDVHHFVGGVGGMMTTIISWGMLFSDKARWMFLKLEDLTLSSNSLRSFSSLFLPTTSGKEGNSNFKMHVLITCMILNANMFIA